MTERDDEAGDREARDMAEIERRLLDDPDSYAKSLVQGAPAGLSPLLDDLAGRWRAGEISAYSCAEAMRICRGDLVLLAGLREAGVPARAMAMLHDELPEAAIDLSIRLARNVAERRRISAGRAGPPGKVRRLADLPQRSRHPVLDALDEPLLVVLTAGRGTRLRTTLPKALVPVGGRPMIVPTIRAARRAGISRMVFVLKFRAEVQREYLSRWGSIVVQEQTLGTAHSAYEALRAVPGWRGPVVMAYSDAPFLPPAAFGRLLDRLRSTGSPLVIGTFRPAGPNLGWILRDPAGAVRDVRQARHGEVGGDEADGGLYALRPETVLDSLGEVTDDNPRAEFNLPSVVRPLVESGHRVETVPGPAQDYMNVNVPEDLFSAEQRVRGSGHEHPGLPEL